VASAVAIAASTIAPTDLLFCFEKRGVLRDVEDEASVIAEITPESYANLRSEGVINKGMLPKIDNAFAAIRAGVRSVIIKHSDELLAESGTIIKTEI
jgi:acetylglutamate kinase